MNRRRATLLEMTCPESELSLPLSTFLRAGGNIGKQAIIIPRKASRLVTTPILASLYVKSAFVDLCCKDDSKDRYSPDAASLLALTRLSLRASTYMKPRPKISKTATFLYGAICSLQIIGIGRVIIVKSVITLRIPPTRTPLSLDPQTPWR